MIPGHSPDRVLCSQRHPRLHGTRGAAEGGSVRQQRRLVFTGLHALQAAPRVSAGTEGAEGGQAPGARLSRTPCGCRHSPFRQHKTKDKHEIDRMTLTMVSWGSLGRCATALACLCGCEQPNLCLQAVELPDSFSPALRSLLEGLLQRDVNQRLGCMGRG